MEAVILGRYKRKELRGNLPLKSKELLLCIILAFL